MTKKLTNKNIVKASPQSMVWEHFDCLIRKVRELNLITTPKVLKQEVALCLFLSIVCVETFINVYFRLLVESATFSKFKEEILTDFKKRKSLDYKIKHWPKLFYNNSLNLSSGIGQKFIQLKEKRNNLTHFNYNYDTFEFGKYKFDGLADITFYKTLEIFDAEESLEIAKLFIQEIFKLKNISQKTMRYEFHVWTGLII